MFHKLYSSVIMAALIPGLASAATVLYGGNGGHTPDQVANGAPPSANNGWIVTINQTTGAVSPLGHPGSIARISGLAFAPGDILYATSINGNNGFPPSGPAAQTSDLLRINPNNGALISDIGAVTAGGTPIEIADLATQPGTGVLFGISAGANTSAPGVLYTINTTTGVATAVGNTGDFFGGIAFAPNGTLYMISADLDANGNIVNQELKTLNPLNANVLSALVLPVSGPAEIYGAFGINPQTGVLYAGNGDAGGLYTLNPSTGVSTLVSNTSPDFIGDIDFRIVPEPASSALYFAGLGLLAYWYRRHRTSEVKK